MQASSTALHTASSRSLLSLSSSTSRKMLFGSMLPFAVLAAAAACRGDHWAECDFEVLLAEADMA